MRLKEIDRVSGLSDKFQELCPNCSYISQTTTHNGVKGRYNGYDLGDGLSVGVFRVANTNTCRIITKGDVGDRQELVTACTNLLSTEGFPEN